MIIKKFFYFIYHKFLKLFLPLLRIPVPKLIQGSNSVLEIPKLIRPNYSHPLIVCDPSILNLKLLDKLFIELDKNKIPYSIYSNVKPNPTISLVNEGRDFFIKNKCDCLISVGGGSSIDLSKLIGVLVANPKKDIIQLKGLLKVRKKPTFHIAIPTTVGSGSEATVAAVIIKEETKDKFAVNDPKLVPNVAILDDELIAKLPKNVISTTGMDSLTHAIESFIGRVSNKFINNMSLKAIDLINSNLFEFYTNGTKESRKNMQLASFYAGVSFTRGFVGYVHALSHSLSGEYNLPHGYANAVLLPVVLEYFNQSIYKKLSIISDMLNLIPKSSTKKEKFDAVIKWIKGLNSSMNIPAKFDLKVSKFDLDKLINHSLKEANPSYPVPKVLSYKDLEKIYQKVL